MDRFNPRALWVLVSFATLAIFTSTPASALPSYTITDLGTLGGTWSSAYSINEVGQIAGYSSINESYAHGFFYDGTMHDLGEVPGGSGGEPWDINSSAQIAIRYSNHAFLYDGTFHDIGTFGESTSSASGINDNGHVTGDSKTSDGEIHAFLYDGNTMHDLHDLNSSFNEFSFPSSHAKDINNSGQIAGDYRNSEGYRHAFLYVKKAKK